MNMPQAAATSLNSIPLPEGTVLVPGDFYGMKLPEYMDDPVMLQPYSLVQFDLPEGYVYIRALTESTYEVINHAPEVAGDMDRVNGLIPMATERETSDQKMLPRRAYGLGDPATQPNVMVTDSSGNSGAAGLMKSPPGSSPQAPQTQAEPASVVVSPVSDSADAVPSGDDPIGDLAGGTSGKGKKQPAK